MLNHCRLLVKALQVGHVWDAWHNGGGRGGFTAHSAVETSRLNKAVRSGERFGDREHLSVQHSVMD